MLCAARPPTELPGVWKPCAPQSRLTEEKPPPVVRSLAMLKLVRQAMTRPSKDSSELAVWMVDMRSNQLLGTRLGSETTTSPPSTSGMMLERDFNAKARPVTPSAKIAPRE